MSTGKSNADGVLKNLDFRPMSRMVGLLDGEKSLKIRFILFRYNTRTWQTPDGRTDTARQQGLRLHAAWVWQESRGKNTTPLATRWSACWQGTRSFSLWTYSSRTCSPRTFPRPDNSPSLFTFPLLPPSPPCANLYKAIYRQRLEEGILVSVSFLKIPRLMVRLGQEPTSWVG